MTQGGDDLAGQAIPIPDRLWSGWTERWLERCGLAMLALVLGQATLYHGAAPFAWGLVVVAWAVDRRDWFAVYAGATAGTWIAVGPVAAGILAVLGLALAVLGRRPLAPVSTLGLASLGGLLLFLGPLSWRPAAVWPLGALDAGLGGLTAWWGRRAWRWITASHTAREPLQASLALFSFAAVVAGMEALHWGWWWPGITLGALVMMAAAVVAGPPGGALAGATLGVTSVLSGGATDSVGLLVVAGFAAGVAGRAGWRWAGLGLLGGFLVYAFYLSSPPRLNPLLLSVGAGALIFLVLPEAAITVFREWLRPLTETPEEAARARLPRVAEVLDQMRGMMTWPDDKPRETSPVDAVVQGVCRRCSLYRRCWDEDFYRSYRAVQEQLTRAETTPAEAEDLGPYLDAVCIKSERLAQAINETAARVALREGRRRDEEEVQEAIHAHLKTLMGLVADMARDLDRAPRPQPERLRLKISVGAAKRARRGGQVSGDTHFVQELAPGRVVMGLSDGMGAGPEAALESGSAVHLLEEVLRRGFSQDIAVRVVNSALVFRAHDERFATLDLALLDLDRHEAELAKVAAAPTFWRRGDRVELIRAESLPIGILRDVRVTPIYHGLEPGDVIVMVSDGALGPPDGMGEEVLRECLAELPVARADVMAETLLQLLRERLGALRDDALVLTAVMGQAGARVDHPRGHPVVGEWRRVTR